MNPASNVKLVTAAAALARLGVEYRFDTEFLIEPGSPGGAAPHAVGPREGRPDASPPSGCTASPPSCSTSGCGRSATWSSTTATSTASGSRPGYEEELSDRPYAAPSGALSLNANAVGVYLRAAAPGAKAIVEIEPPSDYFEVVNAAVGSNSRARRASVASAWTGAQQRITVRGTVPIAGDWAAWKKIDNPPLYFGFTFKRVLEMHGIRVKGKPRMGVVPERAKLLHVARSETLDLVLKRLNKYSSNFVAEQLLKTLGAEVEGRAGQHRQRGEGGRGVPRARGGHPPRLVHPPQRLGDQRHQPLHARGS